MGRFYSVPFSAVAVSAVQDLFEVKAATGKPITLHEIVVGQASDMGDAAAEALSVVIKRGIGNTSGSGGSAVTPVGHNSGMTAAGMTAEVNNTTQAVAGGGSITTIRADAFNIQQGYRYAPSPEQRLLFLPAQSCLVAIVGAPADALTVSGTLVFEED